MIPYIIIGLVVLMIIGAGIVGMMSDDGDDSSQETTTTNSSAQQDSDDTESSSNEDATSPNDDGADIEQSDGINPNGSTPSTESGSDSSAEQNGTQTKSITIDAFNFGFSQSTINVSPGDEVALTLTNSGGQHDWVVDEIPGAQTTVIGSGESETITFTVPESAAGKTFAFYCSVGNHRAQGMEGSLVVASN